MQGPTSNNQVVLYGPDGQPLPLSSRRELLVADQDLQDLIRQQLALTQQLIDRQIIDPSIDIRSNSVRTTPYDSGGRYFGPKRTFRSSTNGGVTAAASTGSFFVLFGSRSKLVTVQRVLVTGGTLTALEYNTLQLRQYFIQPTGGTASILTIGELGASSAVDATFNSSTVSLCQAYTVAPTDSILQRMFLGTRRVILQASTAAAGAPVMKEEWDFRSRMETKGVELRGTNQGIGLNFGTAPGSAPNIIIELEWTEEDY